MSQLPYDDPFLQAEKLVARLKRQGLIIEDEAKAKNWIERVGFHRLNSYIKPMRDHRARGASSSATARGASSSATARGASSSATMYSDGATFKTATDLYIFDKDLRMLMLDVLERVETSIRTDAVSVMHRFGAHVHRDIKKMGPWFRKKDGRTGFIRHDDWLKKLDNHYEKSSEDSIVEYRDRYSTPPPLWIAAELWDFGMLSYFISGIEPNEVRKIAQKYGLPHPEILRTWVHSFSHVRNICAHHGRFWNRSLGINPRYPAHGEVPELDHLLDHRKRAYHMLALARYLVRKTTANPRWVQRLKDLVSTFPRGPNIRIDQAGFPQGWQELPLWN